MHCKLARVQPELKRRVEHDIVAGITPPPPPAIMHTVLTTPFSLASGSSLATSSILPASAAFHSRREVPQTFCRIMTGFSLLAAFPIVQPQAGRQPSFLPSTPLYSTLSTIIFVGTLVLSHTQSLQSIIESLRSVLKNNLSKDPRRHLPFHTSCVETMPVWFNTSSSNHHHHHHQQQQQQWPAPATATALHQRRSDCSKQLNMAIEQVCKLCYKQQQPLTWT